MPDVPIARVLVDTADDVTHSIDLIRPHHQDLLLRLNQNHIPADHLAEEAFGQELLRKLVQVRNLAVIVSGPGVDRQKTLFGVEREVTIGVVGEIVRVPLVADDEDLQEAQQRVRVAVPCIGLVSDNLLQCLARIHRKLLQLDLHHRYPVQEQDDIVTMEAVRSVHA